MPAESMSAVMKVNESIIKRKVRVFNTKMNDAIDSIFIINKPTVD